MNDIDLKGRTAVVTGGAQGIGKAIAKRMLASGASVSLWDVDGDLLEESRTELAELSDLRRVHSIVVDVVKLLAVEAAAADVIRSFGRIDIMIANAGIGGPSLHLWEYPPEAWQQVLDIDLTGVFNCCRTVVPEMIERNYGRILCTSSIAGKEGNPLASAYSAAKAGVIALVKSLGKELADYEISVNCMTPCTAATRILEQFSEEHIEYMRSKIPRGRFVTVEEIAAMAAWLVSEENSFTTGAVFDLSGGRATY